LTINATAVLPLTISLVSLAADGTPGEAANFDNTQNYTFAITRADTITGFDPAAIVIHTTNFQNGLGTKEFSVANIGDEIVLVFGTALPGNVNGDCVVNILDLIGIRNHLNQDPTTPAENAAYDVNGDGSINILDMIYVRNRLNTKCEE
jgi:hypothetical protein